MMDKIIEDIKNPLLIIYKGNEGKWLSYWNREPYKIYSDIFSSDDVKRKFTSIAFISETPNEINYIVNFRRDGIVATNKTKIFFDIVIKLKIPLTINFIIQNVSKAIENSLENVFTNQETIYYLNKTQLKAIISSLELLDKEIINQVKWILYHEKKINNKDDIILSERDALGLVFRINDLDNEINSMANWNVEEISTPDFLRNLRAINIIEDQLIIKDAGCFGDWRLICNYSNHICTLSNGNKYITIIYANRTKIERNIGVDLIYFDHVHHTYIFVQYKRLSERNGKYIYYPASDSSLKKELSLMEKFEAKLSKINLIIE